MEDDPTTYTPKDFIKNMFGTIHVKFFETKSVPKRPPRSGGSGSGGVTDEFKQAGRENHKKLMFRSISVKPGDEFEVELPNRATKEEPEPAEEGGQEWSKDNQAATPWDEPQTNQEWNASPKKDPTENASWGGNSQASPAKGDQPWGGDDFAQTQDNQDKPRGKGCFKCGEEGHFARECPSANDQDKPKGKGCFKCGEDGHFA